MASYTISKIMLPNGDICNLQDTTYTAASTGAAGLMSAADKGKLDAMEVASTSEALAAVNLGILVQPTSKELSIGDTFYMTVVAEGVASYQWQYNNGSSWKDNSGDAAKTAAFSIAVNATRYNYFYRCMLTGVDGTVFYTDTCNMIRP